MSKNKRQTKGRRAKLFLMRTQFSINPRSIVEHLINLRYRINAKLSRTKTKAVISNDKLATCHLMLYKEIYKLFFNIFQDFIIKYLEQIELYNNA